MISFFRKYRFEIALLLIILLGAFLRFYRLAQLTSFHYDTARDMEIMRRMVQDHKLTLLGPPTSFSVSNSSYGTTYFGPIFYYLLAPFLFLSNLNPVGPALMVALLGTLAIVLVFIVTKKMNGDLNASLLAALFIACSPVETKFSRWVWNPNLTPFFSLLLLYAWLVFKENGKNIWAFLAGLCFGVVFQLHFISYWLFLFSGWVLLVAIPSKKIISRLKSLAWFLSGILVLFLPMIIFEIRHGFLNTRSIVFNIMNQPSKNAHLGFSLVHVKQLLLTLSSYFIGEQGGLLRLAFVGFLFLLLAFFFFNEQLRKRYSLALVLFVFGCLGSSIFDREGLIAPNYLLPLSGVFFILMGIFFSELLKIKPITPLVIALILGVSVLSLPQSWREIRQVRPDSIETYKQICSPLINNVVASGLDGNFNIANLLDNDRRAISFRYFLKAKKIPILGVEQYPQADILYVIDKDYGWEGIVNNTDTWEVYSFKPKVLLKVIDGPDGVKIYKIGKKKNG